MLAHEPDTEHSHDSNEKPKEGSKPHHRYKGLVCTESYGGLVENNLSEIGDCLNGRDHENEKDSGADSCRGVSTFHHDKI